MATPKIQIKHITFTFKEGRSHHLAQMPLQVTSWRKANEQLREWSDEAPTDGTYDKTDFTATWQDGSEYSGTYALRHHSHKEEPLDLGAHIEGNLAFHAGTEKPGHMSVEQYEDYLARSKAEQSNAQKALATWSFTD